MLSTTAGHNYKMNTAAFSYTSGSKNQILHNGAITPPVGTIVSDIVQFRLIRDTANASGLFSTTDPVLGSISVLSFDVHFVCDTHGSRTEYSK